MCRAVVIKGAIQNHIASKFELTADGFLHQSAVNYREDYGTTRFGKVSDIAGTKVINISATKIAM